MTVVLSGAEIDAVQALANPRISAVIISCNEADVIEPCLQSVRPWVDEIVVVDMNSTDGTREIACRYADRIVEHERLVYVEPARNFALAQASGEWIIMLDPDERVSAGLASELRRIAAARTADVVVLPFAARFFGHPIADAGFGGDCHPRFFRRGAIDWPEEVHSGPSLDFLRVLRLERRPDTVVMHDTWRSVGAVLDRVQRYAPHEARTLHERSQQFKVRAMLVSVWSAFSGSFVHGRGYRNGSRGLVVGLLLAMYRLVVHLELWEAQGQPQDGDMAVRRAGRVLQAGLRLVGMVRAGLRCVQ